jgi:N-acetylneuraminic acid mutarotase
MAALGSAVYVGGGASLGLDDKGVETREFLKDVWRYTPDKGWSSGPPLPHPVAAAASASMGDTRWLLFGGDTGTHPTQYRPNR